MAAEMRETDVKVRGEEFEGYVIRIVIIDITKYFAKAAVFCRPVVAAADTKQKRAHVAVELGGFGENAA